MAEHIWGSEEEFVAKMNARAKELGMEHTNFLNCNGLDADGHVTTARDIALMSRELITRYPKIHDYSTIWMENITHTTKKGTTEFGLANTNKLIRQYQYATGLKTGSTSKAKFCLSATAKKDDLELIAVIMAAPDPKARFKDATTLLNYGFGKCTKYKDTTPFELEPLKIRGGIEKEVPVAVETEFQYIDTTGANLSGMKRKIEIDQEKQAPLIHDPGGQPHKQAGFLIALFHMLSVLPWSLLRGRLLRDALDGEVPLIRVEHRPEAAGRQAALQAAGHLAHRRFQGPGGFKGVFHGKAAVEGVLRPQQVQLNAPIPGKNAGAALLDAHGAVELNAVNVIGHGIVSSVKDAFNILQPPAGNNPQFTANVQNYTFFENCAAFAAEWFYKCTQVV